MNTLSDGVATLVEHLRALAESIVGLRGLAAYPFLFRPFIFLVLLSVVAGLVGTLVNLRKAEFNAEVMVHSVFPGIVVGFIVGGSDAIIIGAGCAGIAVVIALVASQSSRRESDNESAHEGATAVILTAFFALGMTISLKVGDMSGQLEALMFGRLLETTDSGLAQSLVVFILTGIMLALTWKEHLYVAFDRQGALASRINLRGIDYALNACIAAVVVAASSAIGVLLVIAFLIVPGATGRLLGRTVRQTSIIGVSVSLLASWLGMQLLLTPSPRPISPQAGVVLVLVALFFIAVGIAAIGKRRGKVRC